MFSSPRSFTRPGWSRFFVALAGLALFAARGAQAGPPETTGKEAPLTAEADPIFHHGALDVQFMAGAVFSLQNTSIRRPNFDYAPVVLRLGYMFNNVYGRGFFQGNDEVMLEAFGAGVFTGPGNGLGGLSLLYRRNFLAPNARVIPYFTAGIGGIYTDAYHDRNQGALGGAGEFNIQATTGLRFRVSTQLTVDTEFTYRHFSNAGLADRNLGTNGIGGMIGVSYGF